MGRVRTKIALAGCLLLTGCIMPQPQTRLDVSNCDPRERADCIALSREVFEQIVDAYDDAEKLKEAYRFCKEGI